LMPDNYSVLCVYKKFELLAVRLFFFGDIAWLLANPVSPISGYPPELLDIRTFIVLIMSKTSCGGTQDRVNASQASIAGCDRWYHLKNYVRSLGRGC
jgi:hypothetical protein